MFGHSSEAFKDELVKNVDAKTHEIWREKGSVGKLHDLVYWIYKLNLLTYLLWAIQEEFAGTTNGPEFAGFRDRNPQDVVTDNMIRWLPSYI